MAKLIDLEGLGTFLAKLKSWATAQINSAKSVLQANIDKKVDKTTTVNGHALSGNVTVSKADVGLGNVTNDAQVKRSEMGVANGVATLGGDGTLTSSQCPPIKTINNQKLYGEGNITIDLSLFKVVTSLPTSGIDTSKIYLVLSSSKGTQNTYTEYIYVNSAWEKLGEYRTDVDLTPYVKFTDLATAAKAGAMSASDKEELDLLKTIKRKGIVTSVKKGGHDDTHFEIAVAFTVGDAGDDSNEENYITIPVATATLAGLMAASDRQKLTELSNVNFLLESLGFLEWGGDGFLQKIESVTPDTTRITILFTAKHISATGAAEGGFQKLTLPSAKTTQAGLMSAADKAKLDGYSVATTAEVEALFN